MQISKKQILRDSVIYTVLPKISFIASIIITPFISKNLSLNDFGVYGLILSFASIFQTLIVIGQNVVMQNAFFEFRSKYILIWKRSFGMMIIAGIVGSIIFCFIAYPFLADELKQNTVITFLLISVYIILSPIDVIAINYYVLNQKSYPYAIATAISGLLTQIVILITIKFLNLGYLGWIIAMPCNYIFLYILYSRDLFFKEHIIPVFKFKKVFFKSSLKVGVPLIPHQLSLYILGMSDRLLLDAYKVKTSQIGLYNQAYGLGSYAGYLVNGVFQAFGRFFHERFRSDIIAEQLEMRKFIIFVPLSINITLGVISLWMREIYKFLFLKPELQLSYPIAIIVMCSYMYWSLYALFTYPLVIQKKTSMIAGISLSAAIFNLVANIFFIPKYGIWSAVITTYVGYMIFGIVGIFNKVVRNDFKKYINIYKVYILFFVINIFLVCLSYVMKDSQFIYKLIASLLLILSLYIFLKQKLKLSLKKVN
jgi:O-antigen/teichoic acid export membrane protein